LNFVKYSNFKGSIVNPQFSLKNLPEPDRVKCFFQERGV
jgi:hypothetical protein